MIARHRVAAFAHAASSVDGQVNLMGFLEFRFDLDGSVLYDADAPSAPAVASVAAPAMAGSIRITGA